MILQYLRTFCTVARTGSFTRAAEELGYAQSSVTTQIQKLEQEYGTVLFERFGRRMRLTHSGETLLGYATEMIRLQQESKEALATEASGTLTIGTIESLAAYFLPPLLQAFQARYPRMNLQLKPGLEPGVIQSVKDGDCDIGLILDVPFADPDLHVETVQPVELMITAQPGHRLAGLREVQYADLEQESLILTEEGCTYRALLLQGLQAAGVSYRLTCEFGSLEAIKHCVSQGLGVALLPQMAVQAELESGKLIARPLTGQPDFLVQLIRHKKKWLSEPLQEMLGILVESK
ncbi:DNA-binding transcriptional LysR family regulator [Tumebacillus sp. BK434]|uniref:LysR family transcriptional regulator n=1 Tax=Tumebacillus sp. BK434 TaxID=2512169 RepID=UPI00104D5B92|nr:LysR family transcriptional regulator [Tumebacillus sp. BK434]TCP55485.1 DNA-binding transcriptional LysR family regulator [Tumebacillus sp. BK434]